ncbi:hypothetical protein [Clostridium perfringens]|uniref:hypothetical protein n=1 Tax=Clostridium perfringens TaxID=1502 RepID=UPI0039EA1553
MYSFIPNEIITNGKQISAFIVEIVDDNFRTLLDNGEISYDEYSAVCAKILSCNDTELYAFYEKFITGLISRNVISFVRKSVKASYGGGLFGLSSTQKKKFMLDLKEAFNCQYA